MASFRRRGDRWEFRIREKDLVGDDPISKGGFRTKAEAKAAADKLEYELRMGVHSNDGNMLFSDYYERWMNAYKIDTVAEATKREYSRALNLVNEHFSGVRLKDMTSIDYQTFLNDFSEGRARSTVKKLHKKIAPSLRRAFRDNHISVDVTYEVSFRGYESQKESEKYLNHKEYENLIEALLDGLELTMTTRYMILLQSATGMRIGEIMALQFKDIDFLHNRIDITKGFDYKYDQKFIPTKNKLTRNIEVEKEVLDIIRPFYDYQHNQKIKDSQQRLFAVKGKVPSVGGVNGTLKRACRRADIQKVTSHALRHTHASILILQGVDLAYISERLGHKDMTVTLETYSHVLNELRVKEEKEASKVMKSFFQK